MGWLSCFHPIHSSLYATWSYQVNLSRCQTGPWVAALYQCAHHPQEGTAQVPLVYMHCRLGGLMSLRTLGHSWTGILVCTQCHRLGGLTSWESHLDCAPQRGICNMEQSCESWVLSSSTWVAGLQEDGALDIYRNHWWNFSKIHVLQQFIKVKLGMDLGSCIFKSFVVDSGFKAEF